MPDPRTKAPRFVTQIESQHIRTIELATVANTHSRESSQPAVLNQTNRAATTMQTRHDSSTKNFSVN